ncbi:MAG: hypothetical protein ABSG86_30455 [Thermoguttaceae bacterium]
MNATLVVYALALGGWAMPDPVDSTPPLFEDLSKEPSATPQYTVERREYDPSKTVSPTLDQDRRTTTRVGPGPQTPPWLARTTGLGTGQGQTPTMPSEPTNNTTAGLVPGIPLAPTAPPGQGGNALLGAPLVGGGLPSAPTMAASPAGGLTTGGYRQPMGPAAGGSTSMRPPASFGVPVPPPNSVTDRPVAPYTPPPAISPWQHLYDFNGASQNNYADTVRPMLQQQSINQHTSAQIFNANTMLQQQQSALQRGQQDVPMGPGLANPNGFINYYQNYRGYYNMPQSPTGP